MRSVCKKKSFIRERNKMDSSEFFSRALLQLLIQFGRNRLESNRTRIGFPKKFERKRFNKKTCLVFRRCMISRIEDESQQMSKSKNPAAFVVDVVDVDFDDVDVVVVDVVDIVVVAAEVVATDVATLAVAAADIADVAVVQNVAVVLDNAIVAVVATVVAVVVIVDEVNKNDWKKEEIVQPKVVGFPKNLTLQRCPRCTSIR